MEKKLAEYRGKKLREKRYNKIRNNVESFIMSFLTPKPKIEDKRYSETNLVPPLLPHDSDDIVESDDDSDSIDSTINCRHSYMTWILYALTFILWATTYIIFVKLGFGVVYFMISLLIGMYLNTGKRKHGEISAYSVFNKDCESIDGTLKAEQFEREIRYGAGSVK